MWAPGEVAEWFKAHAWKVCLLKGNGGSNPSFSADRPPRSGGMKEEGRTQASLEVRLSSFMWDPQGGSLIEASPSGKARLA